MRDKESLPLKERLRTPIRAIQGNFDHIMGQLRVLAAAHNKLDSVVEDLSGTVTTMDQTKADTDDISTAGFSGDHADLTDVTTDQHHSRSHDHSNAANGDDILNPTSLDAITAVTEDELDIAGRLILSGSINPSISSNQDNFHTAGMDTSAVANFVVSAACDLTGIDPRNGTRPAEGMFYLIQSDETSTYPVTLRHESASSLSANRFELGGTDLVITPGQNALFRYTRQGASGKWFLVSYSGASSSSTHLIPGFPGEDGETGFFIPGLPGATGAAGAAGATGSAGADGAAGAAGRDGVPGLPGDDGESFFLPGPKGDAGATGSSGAAGADGAPGATGAAGAAGSVGPMGFPGDDGESFFLPGPKGDTGATGATGSAGADGAPGASGTGTSGPPGINADEELTFGMWVPPLAVKCQTVLWSSRKRVSAGQASQRIYLPEPCNIVSVYFTLPASSTATATIDVKKNGTTIFTGSGPTLASGYISNVVVPTTQAMTTTDYLTVHVTLPGNGGGRLVAYIMTQRR